jgi:hypothetical protein
MTMKIEESGKQEGLEGSGFRVQGSGFRVQKLPWADGSLRRGST